MADKEKKKKMHFSKKVTNKGTALHKNSLKFTTIYNSLLPYIKNNKENWARQGRRTQLLYVIENTVSG